MASPSPPAGGALIAIGAMAGTAIGFLFGQATPGFLAGLALGSAAAVWIWLRSRRA